MINLTTLLISAGLIVAGLFLAWKWYKQSHPPAKPTPRAAKKSAMDQLLEVKSTKGQSVVTGDSQRVSASKKGILEK